MEKHEDEQSPWLVLPLVLVLPLSLVIGAAPTAAQEPGGPEAPGFSETRRYDAASARQGVAVGHRFFYAISNQSIEKFDKASGLEVGEWKGPEAGPIVHLNGGVLVERELWCAHSNHPGVPMTSSIERFDTVTLEHVGSHSFGIYEGSATWVAVRDGERFVAFAHYGAGANGGTPGKGPEWTSLVRFDDAWRRTGGWVFPPALVDRFAPHSSSGGAFGPDGRLYVTGHDAPEVYVLEFPEAGSELMWVETLPAPIAGQGISFDPGDPRALWGIVKRDRQVVVGHRDGS